MFTSSHAACGVCQSHPWALTVRQVNGSHNPALKAAEIMTTRCFSGKQIFVQEKTHGGFVTSLQLLKHPRYSNG